MALFLWMQWGLSGIALHCNVVAGSYPGLPSQQPTGASEQQWLVLGKASQSPSVKKMLGDLVYQVFFSAKGMPNSISSAQKMGLPLCRGGGFGCMCIIEGTWPFPAIPVVPRF